MHQKKNQKKTKKKTKSLIHIKKTKTKKNKSIKQFQNKLFKQKNTYYYDYINNMIL